MTWKVNRKLIKSFIKLRIMNSANNQSQAIPGDSLLCTITKLKTIPVHLGERFPFYYAIEFCKWMFINTLFVWKVLWRITLPKLTNWDLSCVSTAWYCWRHVTFKTSSALFMLTLSHSTDWNQNWIYVGSISTINYVATGVQRVPD